jgi:DNA-binding CsgD family transcriptional regulator
VVSVQRRREQPDFDRQEIQLFGWFALQWARAIDYARLRSQSDHPPLYGDYQKPSNFQIVTPPPAEIVVSSTGHLIDVSEAAQRVLAALPRDQSFALPGPSGPAHIWYTPGQVCRVQSHACPPESLLSMTQLSALPTLMPRYRPPAMLKIPRLGQPFITLIEPLPQVPALSARLESLKLSPREQEVVTLRLQGLLIKQIAGRCGLQETTAKELAKVYRKAGVRTGREFMAFMLGNELHPPIR